MTARKKKTTTTRRKPPGRPILLDDKRKAIICEAIKLGATWNAAAAAARICASTLATWRRRGKKEDKGIYADLVRDLEFAEAQGVSEALASIDKAHKNGDWKAAAWRLERRYPQDYGRGRLKRPGPLTKEQQEELANPPALTLDVMGATWMRCLQVAERGYADGNLSAGEYLRTVSSLSGLAGRAIEIQSRQADVAEVPPIEINVSLDSPHVADNAGPATPPGQCGDKITIQ